MGSTKSGFTAPNKSYDVAFNKSAKHSEHDDTKFVVLESTETVDAESFLEKK